MRMGLGIMASTLISLAAQYPPPASDRARAGARFVVLDGTPEDDPQRRGPAEGRQASWPTRSRSRDLAGRPPA